MESGENKTKIKSLLNMKLANLFVRNVRHISCQKHFQTSEYSLINIKYVEA
jgi:hypothetical protein